MLLSLTCLVICHSRPAAAQVDAVAEEARVFNAAVRAFEDGVYDRAEKELAEFVAAFPRSERKPGAILLQARAAMEQRRPQDGARLLTEHLADAGFWSDRYHYWLAETELQVGNYQAAALGFARVMKEFPKSPRVLEASYREAWARFQLGDTLAVIQLLQDPGSVFQTLLAEGGDERVAREGYFLLAEALLKHGRHAEAEKSVRTVNVSGAPPDVQWRRQHLLCRIQLEAQQLAPSLAGTSNLVAIATSAGLPGFLVESVEFQAGLLEKMQRSEEAVLSYEQNLAPSVPEPRRRQALFKIVELTLAQQKTENAITKLGEFLTAQPNDPAADIVLLTLGELHLGQTAAFLATNTLNGATTTNLPPGNQLQQALARFNALLIGFPNSPLMGRAQLGRGWCLWAGSRISESQAAFQIAADRLPPSLDQAVALFKLADAQFRQNDFTNAIHNLSTLVERYAGDPAVKEKLFAHAWYQILRASIEAQDLLTATETMRRILAEYPDSDFRDPGLLLVVQAVGEAGETAQARAIFDQYTKAFPNALLLPEVLLASARTHVQDRDWPAAIEQYNQWIERFPTNSLRPRVEFDQAWAHDMAGQSTNALTLFTNFIARFPTNQLAANALFWVGDFHYQQKQYVDALRHYQQLAEAFPGALISYEARMMAGRAAFASGLFWKDAAGPSGHFTTLATDESCPPGIRAAAYFALGDSMIARGRTDTNTTVRSFEEAVGAFSRILTGSPTNALIPLAWGRLGDCHLQLGALDPKEYPRATNAYHNVIDSPLADITARSQAEVGIGLVLEKMAQLRSSPGREPLLNSARDHYLNVLYGSNLKAGEKPDPLWLKNSGLAAAALAESEQQWVLAANYYKRLAIVLPPLKTFLERRLERAQAQMRQRSE